LNWRAAGFKRARDEPGRESLPRHASPQR